MAEPPPTCFAQVSHSCRADPTLLSALGLGLRQLGPGHILALSRDGVTARSRACLQVAQSKQ